MTTETLDLADRLRVRGAENEAAYRELVFSSVERPDQQTDEATADATIKRAGRTFAQFDEDCKTARRRKALIGQLSEAAAVRDQERQLEASYQAGLARQEETEKRHRQRMKESGEALEEIMRRRSQLNAQAARLEREALTELEATGATDNTPPEAAAALRQEREAAQEELRNIEREGYRPNGGSPEQQQARRVEGLRARLGSGEFVRDPRGEKELRERLEFLQSEPTHYAELAERYAACRERLAELQRRETELSRARPDWRAMRFSE